MFNSCNNDTQTIDCTLFVRLSTQLVTVSMECAIKVQRVMDSVCVSHRTPENAVTKVGPLHAGLSVFDYINHRNTYQIIIYLLIIMIIIYYITNI